MSQKLPKFLKVAQKTASCVKVAEQVVDRATRKGSLGYRGAFISQEKEREIFQKKWIFTDFCGFFEKQKDFGQMCARGFRK